MRDLSLYISFLIARSACIQEEIFFPFIVFEVIVQFGFAMAFFFTAAFYFSFSELTKIPVRPLARTFHSA